MGDSNTGNNVLDPGIGDSPEIPDIIDPSVPTEEPETEETGTPEPTVEAIRLTDIPDLDDRYTEFMSATTVDINDYISDNYLPLMECQYMSRFHRLHEQLNTIIDRLNQMDVLIAAIARNTQTITITQTTKE